MPFPDSPRVIYSNNPLEQVICQLQFPPILKIVSELPAQFQDAIRQEYPLFNSIDGTQLKLPPQLLEKIPSDFLNLMGSSQEKHYNFISLDKQWTVSLTKDFIALKANNYRRWEEFKEHFGRPFDAFLEYSPAEFSRVGLRYRNVIQRSILGLDNTPWSELLEPYIAGSLTAPDSISNSIENMNQLIEIRLANVYGKVKIRHGFVVDNSSGEICYLIDSDFFAERIKRSEDVLVRLDRFNRRGRRLFRWCITQKLHDAMGPEPI